MRVQLYNLKIFLYFLLMYLQYVHLYRIGVVATCGKKRSFQPQKVKNTFLDQI